MLLKPTVWGVGSNSAVEAYRMGIRRAETSRTAACLCGCKGSTHHSRHLQEHNVFAGMSSTVLLLPAASCADQQAALPHPF
jgi:hypothetical protein